MENNIGKKTQKKTYVLGNIMEEIVRAEARSIINGMHMCTCEKCFIDVCAMALNSLTPRYVTTLKGSLFAQIEDLDPNEHVHVTMEVTRAAKKVKSAPQHTEEQE